MLRLLIFLGIAVIALQCSSAKTDAQFSLEIAGTDFSEKITLTPTNTSSSTLYLPPCTTQEPTFNFVVVEKGAPSKAFEAKVSSEPITNLYYDEAFSERNIHPYVIEIRHRDQTQTNEPVATFTFDVHLSPCAVSALAGKGTSDEPWQIDSAMKLALVARLVNQTYTASPLQEETTPNSTPAYATQHYVLTTDIDLGDTSAPWSRYRYEVTQNPLTKSSTSAPQSTRYPNGFIPIGTTFSASWDLTQNAEMTNLDNYSNHFNGTFDCQGHIISNLFISNTNLVDVAASAGNAQQAQGVFQGFFGIIGQQATIRNCTFYNPQVTALQFVGTLAGMVYRGNVVNVAVVATRADSSITATQVNSLGGEASGGLVGVNSGGVLTAAYTTLPVRGVAKIGGLVGYHTTANDLRAIITTSYTTGKITGTSYVGGVVGMSKGIVTTSYSTSDVVATGLGGGGLIGFNDKGAIATSYTTGSVRAHDYVGGLVGYNIGTPKHKWEGHIETSYTISSITASSPAAQFKGGIIGYNISGESIYTYWNKDVANHILADANAKTTTAMRQAVGPSAEIYTDWNMASSEATSTENGDDVIWRFKQGTYPRLVNVVCANRQYIIPIPTGCVHPLP